MTKADRLERSLIRARLERERYLASSLIRIEQIDAQLDLLDGATHIELQRRHRRRAFLIGEYVLDHLIDEPDLYAQIFSALDTTLSDPAQRQLFDLE